MPGTGAAEEALRFNAGRRHTSSRAMYGTGRPGMVATSGGTAAPITNAARLARGPGWEGTPNQKPLCTVLSVVSLTVAMSLPSVIAAARCVHGECEWGLRLRRARRRGRPRIRT